MLPNYSFLRRLDMEPVADVLKQCTLFKDMTHKDIDKFLKVSSFSILSKELSRMREEGIIKFDKEFIMVKDYIR